MVNNLSGVKLYCFRHLCSFLISFKIIYCQDSVFEIYWQSVPDICSFIDLFHKWRLLHGNEARMLFSQSMLVSNYKIDMISFLTFFLLSIRVSF